MGSILYLHTDTETCMHICILTADYTEKPDDYTVKAGLIGHSKKKINYHLMQVKSIAECSKGTHHFIKIFVLPVFEWLLKWHA